MKFDASISYRSLREVPALAQAAEALGFSGLWLTETQHDPFLACALIASHTKQIEFGTAIAVSFARSPGTMAYTSWDLAESSRGRFILGLGTQVKAHIVRRFGLDWPDSPVSKLREQVQALRAFWDTWQQGTPLNFRGDYYKLTLMSPFFNPGPIADPDIPIYLAGVNTGMAGLAGELAQGFHVHPFHTPRYLREVLLPAIQEGAARNQRSQKDIAINITAFFATNEAESAFARQQIAFYASTPSYRPVMALHGWQDTAEKLSGLAAKGQWQAMSELITDQMLSTFAVVSRPAELPEALVERYKGLADRLSIYTAFIPGERDEMWKALAGAVRQTG